jgi:hypothetical protein
MVDLFTICCTEPAHPDIEPVLRVLVDQDIGFAIDFAVAQDQELLDEGADRPLDQVRRRRRQRYLEAGRVRRRYDVRCPLCGFDVQVRAEKLNALVMELHRYGRTSLSLRGLQAIV